VASQYIIVRNFRGRWPNWYANLDDGQVLYVRIRHGRASLGLGTTEDAAIDNAKEIGEGPQFDGVTDAVDAVLLMRELGYYWVCQVSDR
jgi:hypothetical protein